MASLFKYLVLPLAFFVCTLEVAAQKTTLEYNQQAKQAYNQQQYDEVINAATLSLNVSLNGEAYWWRALGYYYKQNYPLAISDITKAIPYYTSVKSSLGNLYALRGDAKYNSYDYKAAIEDYDYLLKNYEYSNKKRIYENLANSYTQLGDYQGAITSYTNAISNTTNSNDLSDLYHKRGLVRDGHGDADDIIMSDFNSAIRLNKQNAEAFYSRGALNFINKKFDAARADLTEAAVLFEKNGKTTENMRKICQSYSTLAGTYYNTQNYDEAKEYYLKAIQYDSTYGYNYWNLGKLNSRVWKKYEEASTYFKKAARLISNKIDKSDCLSDYFFNERANLKFNVAMEIINSAIANEPENAFHYWDKAYLLSLRKDRDAIKQYDKALSLKIKDSSQKAALYLERGRFKMKMNDVQGALFDIQNSIAYKPSYSNYYALGTLFKTAMKQTELANGNFQKAMSFAIIGPKQNDTTSDYAYAAAAMGDKITAERFIKNRIIDASSKIGALANEYHNAACIYSILGNFSKALIYLELSLQAGYTDFEHMLHDDDLEPLTKLPEYKTLLVNYKVPTPIY